MKVFRINTEFRIFSLLRGHFSKTCKSGEFFGGGVPHHPPSTSRSTQNRRQNQVKLLVFQFRSINSVDISRNLLSAISAECFRKQSFLFVKKHCNSNFLRVTSAVSALTKTLMAEKASFRRGLTVSTLYDFYDIPQIGGKS